MSAETIAYFDETAMATPGLVADALEATKPLIAVVASPGRSENGEGVRLEDQFRLLGAITDPQESEMLQGKIFNRLETLYPSLGNVALGELELDTYNEMRRSLIGRSTKASVDPTSYAALGNYISAQYFSRYLRQRWEDAYPGQPQRGSMEMRQIRVDASNGAIDLPWSRAAIESTRNNYWQPNTNDCPVVIPGAIGYDSMGQRRPLNCEPDRVASLYAAGLGYSLEVWTTQDGVLSAGINSDNIPNARVIPKLTWRELAEARVSGVGLLEGDVALDLDKANLAARIRNVGSLKDKGSLIENTADIDPSRPITLIVGEPQAVVTIHDMKMADQLGYLSRLTKLAARHQLSIEQVPRSRTAATLTFASPSDPHNIDKFKQAFEENNARDSRTEAAVSDIRYDLGMVRVIGEALTQLTTNAEVLTSIMGRLWEERIYTHAVVSHPEGASISLLVNRNEITRAIEALHEQYLTSV